VRSILWTEACGIPDAIGATLDRRQGFDAALEAMSGRGIRRIVATGNGASYYAAMALWLASLEASGPDVVAVPAGVVARPGFRWRDGDVLLAISSSGEFRDVVAAVQQGATAVAITANDRSSLARQVRASAVARLDSQRSVTHTQGYAANVAVALSLWADLTGDPALRGALARSPEAVARVLGDAESWAAAQAASLEAPPAAVAFGSGPAWAASLEAALLLKEVARIPAEGVETREGATSAMYGIGQGHLAVSVVCGDDPQLAEAESVCRSAGATVIGLTGAEASDPRVAPILSFPAALALAIALAERSGVDVDAPWWAGAYERTARPAAQPVRQTQSARGAMS
jgi:fructoselysine-6-P-deglycase FrlB-like protein